MAKIQNKELENYINNMLKSTQKEMDFSQDKSFGIEILDNYFDEIDNFKLFIKTEVFNEKVEEYLISLYLLVTAISNLRKSLENHPSSFEEYSLSAIKSIEKGSALTASALVRTISELSSLIIVLTHSKKDFKLYSMSDKKDSKLWIKEFESEVLKNKVEHIEKELLSKNSFDSTTYRKKIYGTLSKIINPSYESVVLNKTTQKSKKYEEFCIFETLIEPLHYLHFTLLAFLSTLFDIVSEIETRKNFPPREALAIVQSSKSLFLNLHNWEEKELRKFN